MKSSKPPGTKAGKGGAVMGKKVTGFGAKLGKSKGGASMEGPNK